MGQFELVRFTGEVMNMRFVFLFVALFAVPSFASDADKTAERALLLAKEKKRSSKDAGYDKIASSAVEEAKLSRWEKLVATTALDYEKGYRASVLLKKPMVVMVNVDCREVCKHLRPEFVTVHEKSFQGSDAPKVILVLPVGDKVYRLKSWDGRLPTAEEIRRELKAGLESLKLGSVDYYDYWSTLGLTQWVEGSCPGGVCPVNTDGSASKQSSPPVRMPIGDGPVVYEYTVVRGDVVWVRRPLWIRRPLFLVRRLLGLFW